MVEEGEEMKTRVLIVDDEPAIRTTTRKILEKGGFEAATACDAMEALALLEAETFDVLLSDIIMPGMDGVELMQRALETAPQVKVVLITGEPTVESAAAAVRTGAFDYLPKPVNRADLLKIVGDAGRFKAIEDENRAYQRDLEAKVTARTASLRRTLLGTVEALASALEVRDPYTAGHQRRVARVAVAIADDLGYGEDRREGLRLAGLLHDIGKLHIPAEILAKPTRLTKPEFALIKDHSRAGWDILKRVEFPWPLARMVLQHHERMDGSGYPDGLGGADILPEARILAVADVIEAMASHRPYRPAVGLAAALDVIIKGRGSHFDPAVVDAALSVLSDGGEALLAEAG
jgi:putative two-component system response regulator